MASKVLSDADLNTLMNEVKELENDPAKLKALAEEFQRKLEQDKEKRKKYHQNKSPEQVAKQREYMKRRSAVERERRSMILKAAREAGLISADQ